MIIEAYRQGYFPMAEEFDGKIYWHSPDPRAIIPLDRVKVPRSMKQILKKDVFTFRINYDFETVIRACADRRDTWISEEMIGYYKQLHNMGFVHTVETYMDEKLVGGLYGVTIGGAFCGESMFSYVSNASKAAFYILVERLKQRGYILLDSQYINSHTEMLGAVEIPKYLYLEYLHSALLFDCKFD